MKRPKPNDYSRKDFVSGVYEKALEIYISFLENKIRELESKTCDKNNQRM